jgi:hypothetical protein
MGTLLQMVLFDPVRPSVTSAALMIGGAKRGFDTLAGDFRYYFASIRGLSQTLAEK